MMKKNRMALPLVLAVGVIMMGIMTVGCPSDPETTPLHEVETPDITLKLIDEPAQHKEPITDFLIEKGKTYVVTLAVTDLDEVLVDGFFGGVLLYEPGGDEEAVRVSEWAHSATGAISSGEKTYRWEFEATESTPEDMQNSQYFQLMAQNSDYKNWKDSDTFGIKGSITVAEKGAIIASDYTVTEVTTKLGSGTVTAIESDEYTRVLAEKDTAGSFLRLYVTDKDGGNIGKIGPDKKKDDFLNLNSNSAGIIDVSLAELFVVNTEDYNYININIWKPTNPTDGLTKVELWVPK
jgi:hypothetical protein